MLRVTVELWPGGRESGKRVIATANIARVKDGALADYEVGLREGLLGDVGDTVRVRGYPRWSASVWDLVGRSIAAALSAGTEQLPPRPTSPVATVHVRSDGTRFVRLGEIPEPSRTFFGHNLNGSSIPAHDCAYAHDWIDFLNGHR